MSRQRLVTITLGLWLAVGSFVYLRQFVAQGMWFLNRILGR